VGGIEVHRVGDLYEVRQRKSGRFVTLADLLDLSSAAEKAYQIERVGREEGD